jgi:deazaflavin-dependent oxidoreductase (nitroreductase family)
MVRIIAFAVGALLTGAASLLGLLVVGLRRKSAVVMNLLRRISRDRFNPAQLRSAGTAGAYASIVEHTGRVSGRPYRTPVAVRAVDDGFVISLTYGTRADWVRNVLAAGSATLVTEGETHEIDDIRLVPIEEAGSWFSAKDRRIFRLLAIEHCLRLTPRSAEGGP